MATYTINQVEVQYDGFDDGENIAINAPYFSAYWGASITANLDYSNGYRLKITGFTLSLRMRCNGGYKGSGKVTYKMHPLSTAQLLLCSYYSNGIQYGIWTSMGSATVSKTGGKTGVVNPGDNYYGSCSKSGIEKYISFPYNSTCSIRGFVKVKYSTSSTWRDWGMIFASPHIPAFNPNTPGYQFCTGRDSNNKPKWTTKLPRYNKKNVGWVDTKIQFYGKNGWEDIRG